MVARCLEDSSPFGIVRIRAGREVGMVQPDLERVGTVAEIRESARRADGRFDLVVVGVGRVAIGAAHEVPEGYLVASVEALDETVGDPERARILASVVSQRFVRYLELLRPVEGESGPEIEVEVEVEGEGDVEVEGDPDVEGAEIEIEIRPLAGGEPEVPEPASGEPSEPNRRDARLDEVARRLAMPDDPTAFSHLLSGIVQVEAARRQHLLEAPTTEARLERLDALLRQEIFLLERRLAAFVADPRATLLRRN